ncbi:MAG: hypothetical protein AABW64_04330 [Nanoarchaeota archaeon]
MQQIRISYCYGLNPIELCPFSCFSFALSYFAFNVVPVSHAEKFRKKLKNANIIIYESKNGHFKISEFPEIVTMIKNDTKRK